MQINLPLKVAATVVSAIVNFVMPSSATAGGQDHASAYQEQAKLIKAPEAALKLGKDMFGDTVNLYTGGVSFKHTDVAIPGNNSLAVSVGRKLTVGMRAEGGRPFGQWSLDIPHLYGTYSTKQGWVSPLGDGKRCSNFGAPPQVSGGGAYWIAAEYWSGAFLSLPGSEDQRLLKRAADFLLAPGPVASYPVVTTDLWTFQCLPTLSNSHLGAVGEGFLAFAPDGTRYRFDWMVVQGASTIKKYQLESSAPPNYSLSSGQTSGLRSGISGSPTVALDEPNPQEPPPGGGVHDNNVSVPANIYVLSRSQILLLPTVITDRFGNTVTYEYDPARPKNLKSITASDGRKITLSYGGAGEEALIKTVSDGTRTWSYSYSSDVDKNLSEVVLPDSSKWELAGLVPLLTDVFVTEVNKCGLPLDVYFRILTGSIKHPSGAWSDYTFTPLYHGRTDVPAYCGDQYRFSQTAKWFYTNTLTSRTIRGVGFADKTWTYAYLSSSAWRPCGTVCDLGKKVTVSDPEANVTRYTFGNRFESSEGKLLKVEEGWNGTTALRTVTTRYRPAGAREYVSQFGTTDRFSGDAGTTVKNQPADQTITMQQGVEFSTTTKDFTEFVRPKFVVKSSMFGTRSETYRYTEEDDITKAASLSKWVLGQPISKTLSTNDELKTPNVTDERVVESRTYYADTLLPKTIANFGLKKETLAYNSDGTLKTTSDAANQTTAFSDYKRGIPRKIVYADATSKSASVNDTGTLASITDETNATTSFKYDAAGRLARIIYPVPDSQESLVWNDTVITYTKAVAVENGLPAGHWQMSVATGNAVKKMYLDSFWRPLVTETYDANDPNTRSVVRKRFDINGNLTFQSYPQRTFADATTGVETLYDALDRATTIKADSELGVLLSSVQYLHGFMKRETNARGYSTDSYFQAFGAPDEALLAKIDAPKGVTMKFDRDNLGKTTAITRSGDAKSAVRSYVYDSTERLCKTIEPETGATVQAYDVAGNVAWRAAGMALPALECNYTSVPTPSKTVFGYDTRNRLTSTTYGDGSPSIGRTYKPDGLPATITSNGSVWTSEYNTRRLLKKDTLAYAGTNYVIARHYDQNASLRQLIYPASGPTIDYAPNALGQPTKVGSYASAITYHPNGAIKSFNYGNGIAHTTSQNARGLAEQATDGGVLSDHYTYDENGNVRGIADLVQGPSSRTMEYDELDRLWKTQAPSLWGEAAYSYDALDNLTTVSIGAGATARSTTHEFSATTNRLDKITSPIVAYNFGYGYDVRGNIVKRGTQTFTFDQANRLKEAVGKATYAYDGLGHRISTIGKDGVNRLQLYTPDGVLLQSGVAGGLHTRYVHLGRNTLAQIGGDNLVTYHHTDALGSPVVRTNATAAVMCRTHYEPYGLVAAGRRQNIGFTGHVADVETGLNYMQQRYYDPVAGRFLSIDPVTTDANTGSSFNRYAYALNNPYKYIDPDGRDTAIIYGGGTLSNPFGHIAIAFSGKGTYSFGTGTPKGSSTTAYVNSQSKYRSSGMIIVPSTPKQEAAMIKQLNSNPSELPTTTDGAKAMLNDNCATRTADALVAGGLLTQAGIGVTTQGTGVHFPRDVVKAVIDQRSDAKHVAAPEKAAAPAAAKQFDEVK